jgi:formiminotetrahydrofolate cyclodeaminase
LNNPALLSEETLQTFLDSLASAAATPGGGGAAALHGAMAAALVSMVCNLTIGRKRFADIKAQIGDILTKSEGLRAKLTRLISQDAEAVQTWLAAYHLPKDSGAEKAARLLAIQEGAKKTVLTSLDTVQACADLIELGYIVAGSGNPNVVGDAYAAVFCAQAGLKIAALNALLNLKLISDEDFINHCRAKLDQFLTQHKSLWSEVYRLAENGS